jgi:hypothetical protein
MAKYVDKQKLKELIEKEGDSSALTCFLILEGYSYDEAQKGLEPYIACWEESVAIIEKSRLNQIGSSEEYDYDLWLRTELFRVLQYASEDEKKLFEERIEIADARFKNATTKTNFPNNHIANPDRESH